MAQPFVFTLKETVVNLNCMNRVKYIIFIHFFTCNPKRDNEHPAPFIWESLPSQEVDFVGCKSK